MMRRREFFKEFAGLAALTALPRVIAQIARKNTQRLNLLFLTADDMNWSLPGFMGCIHGLTPNLDRLAARSHRFVRNRASAPICQPSREAMMTGRVPHRSGGLGFDPIHEGVPTMTTVLKSAGYYTVGIHKLNHMQPDSCFPWDYAVPGMGRAPSEYANAVRAGIEQARKRNQPFFINCNINDPHRPFYGSPEAARVDHNEQGEYKIARELKAEDVTVPPILEDLPEVRREFAEYCNSAQRMDVSIGAVLDVLAEIPEAANTILFFSADHGMPFPFSKATVYDYGTRTPALLCYPGMGAPRTFDQRTCNIDYMPTLLELLSVPGPGGIDGRSWLPILRNEAPQDREYLVTHVNGVSSGAQYPMRAIQNERYSLVFMPWSDGKLQFDVESMDGLTYPALRRAAGADAKISARLKQYIMGIPLAFYDLENDPGQRYNLIAHKDHAQQIAGMKQRLLAYMRETGDPQLDNFQRLLSGKPTVVQQPDTLRNLLDNFQRLFS
jgi:N-sulfoglucosamine sulfohydrolase